MFGAHFVDNFTSRLYPHPSGARHFIDMSDSVTAQRPPVHDMFKFCYRYQRRRSNHDTGTKPPQELTPPHRCLRCMKQPLSNAQDLLPLAYLHSMDINCSTGCRVLQLASPFPTLGMDIPQTSHSTSTMTLDDELNLSGGL